MIGAVSAQAQQSDAPAPQAYTLAPQAETLAQSIGTALVEEGLVGATWALVTPERTTVGAAGIKDVSRNVPLSPGDRFSYSNTGYLLLGMLMEAVTGMRYEAWLDAELLAPLGMHRSTAAFVTQSGPRADALNGAFRPA